MQRPSRRRLPASAASGLVLLLAACGATPPGRLIAVATQSPAPLFQLGTGCPDALLEGTLAADEAAGFVVRHADGFSSPVVWPHGYVARDAEPRELLDGAGRVVAHEGDHFSGGGGWIGETDAEGFTVCGEFTVTPAGTD